MNRTDPTQRKLRVLLVPDSIHWITGTIAQSIVAHNSWVEGTIISGAVLDVIARGHPEFFDSFDLVHFVCPYASRQWLPLLRDRVPCVTSHHHVSDDWELQRHNLGGDAIIVGSSQWAADIQERGAASDKVVCVPYGVDASRFVPATSDTRQAARSSLGIDANALAIGFFAKLSSNERDRKGTDILTAAVLELHAELPSLAVLIIGPGWDELVAQLRASDVHCVWVPFVADADRMPVMYQALDFYWVTARVEGGPVTLLEAMSTGLCCITTPVGLANDIVESGVNAVMVPFDDVRAFVAQTRALASNPRARSAMSALARDTILRTMDVPVTSQGVSEAYDVALAQFESRTQGTARPPVDARLAPDILARAAILEELTWAEALLLQGQRVMALRIMTQTWAKHPSSTLPPRFLLRNLLPARLVRGIVRAKVGVGGRS